MNAQLAGISEQFRVNSNRAREVVATAGATRLSSRPSENAWSVAECLAHLTISTNMYLPIWRDALMAARLKGLQAKGPFRMDLLGRTFTWFLEPPPRIKVKAPAALAPVPAGPAEQVLPDFLAAQEQLLAIVANADGLALDRVMVPSPAIRRLRYSVWSGFCLSAAHQRRHLWQARRVLSQ